MSTEPMFSAAMYGSAEAAREAEVKWLRGRIAELEAALGQGLEIVRAENEALLAAIDRAETSYSGLLRGDDKLPTGTTEYTRGWGDCLRAIDAARAAREGKS